MAVPNRTGVPDKTSQTGQYVLNYSFDELYKILMVGLTAYNPTTQTYDRVQIGSNGTLTTGSGGASGIGTDTTLTLTAASTSYQVPASPPSSAYLLMLYNGSDTDMYITFTSSTTGGVKLAAGANLNIDLGASQSLFAYSGGTGKVLNVSYKVI